MFSAYVVVGTLTAIANATFAALDFVRSKFVLENMERVHVQRRWLYPLGLLKLAGAVGLIVGIAVPSLGIAAAIGLVLFFAGAIVAHIRADDLASIPFPGAILLASLAALVLRLASA